MTPRPKISGTRTTPEERTYVRPSPVPSWAPHPLARILRTTTSNKAPHRRRRLRPVSRHVILVLRRLRRSLAPNSNRRLPQHDLHTFYNAAPNGMFRPTVPRQAAEPLPQQPTAISSPELLVSDGNSNPVPSLESSSDRSWAICLEPLRLLARAHHTGCQHRPHPSFRSLREIRAWRTRADTISFGQHDTSRRVIEPTRRLTR